MARYTDAVCKLCRREGTKLFLKADRCYTEKCAFDRRSYGPGQHGLVPKKYSDYGVQLREKQKVKRMYGVLEKQFRLTFEKAVRMKGRTGDNLMSLLERRLDNVVYRCGFVNNRVEGRLFVRHGHFLVNNKKVDIPSYIVRKDDVVSVRETSRKLARTPDAIESVDRRGIPKWLEVDKTALLAKVAELPSRDDVTMPIKEQLIVELYSK
ncbi:MAG: 30S ribosomal protein S4 [Deltaproteobacteria bacterium]|nr:30S ribosomal protein S4 [Deltaproteobacteria bacterium]